MTESPTHRARIAVSPAGAADLIGVSRAFIYTEMQRGNLRSLKLGRVRRITIAEIERYLHAAELTTL